MNSRLRMPRLRYGPNYDGALDPARIRPAERLAASTERQVTERDRRNSPSPMIRALQRATDRTFRKVR